MDLTPAALADFQAHACEVWPEECCGLLIDAKYVRCSNSADDPRTDFYINPTELLGHRATGDIQAVLHSHPFDPTRPPSKDLVEWPSEQDMRSWIADTIPWGIVSCNGQGCSAILWLDDGNRPPLLDRYFVHGVTDCYSLIRDYYFLELGINLKNYARGWSWWESGKDHYSENFADAGFTLIKRSELKVGDVILYKIRSPVVNHGAVVVGPDTIIHHFTNHKSKLQKLSDYDRFATHYLRYTA
jgi:proteasome lid subunit RPN8/RPN11